MLLCDDQLFVHVPKVGGMSMTAWLLNNLDGQIILSVPKSAQDHALSTLEFDDIKDRLSFLPGGRHERVNAALDKCERWQLPRPKTVYVFVRPAYDLLRSYFQYVRLPHVSDRMRAKPKLAPDVETALSGDFKTFAETCSIMGKGPDDMMGYYHTESDKFDLHIVPIEHAFDYVGKLYAHHENCGRMSLGKRNKAREALDFDPAAYEVIQQRFARLEQVYQQAKENWPDLSKQL